MRWTLLFILLIISAYIVPDTTLAHPIGNVTEHSWMYFTGYMDDMRIYQTASGFHGQKLVTGTRGSGIVSRTIDAQVYSGEDSRDMSFNEWGVYTYRPYQPPLTQSDLKNALCAKNYDVGSVISESYSNIRELVKDTNIQQDQQVSVYEINTELMGTAKIGSRVRTRHSSAPVYVMGGTYVGNMNLRTDIEAGNASILTLPCP
ncbi:MAG: hypothetical protein LUQ38_11785 [Methanotrichaceae archaeon]|nr:hypothetical protein [Methanotrichaceae archaeon]MDD1757976.1 hypothetical protein [Methanotrichaceae archaeon]